MKPEDKVKFNNEKLPYTIKAINEKYAICTRRLHRRHDADILKHKVEMGAYCSFAEAYNSLKNEVIYTIIDLKNKVRSTDNYVFGGYDYSKQNEINEALIELTNGEFELSKRNMCEL